MTEAQNFKVMVVDDTKTNIEILLETLGDDYDVSVAMDGESALEFVAEETPDLILLDIMMPGMDGYDVCKQLKKDDATKNIPVIFLTAMTGEQDEALGLELGAVDYVTKPFNPCLVKARVHNQLELKQYRDRLEILVSERTRQLKLTQEVTIECLGSLAEYRDPETGGHIKRTRNYIRALACKLKNNPKYINFLDERTIEQLFTSAPLHDIGKVGVPDSILLKPGKLTDEEFEKMKKHVTYGRNAIRAASSRLGEESFLKYAEEIAYTHHEKWDGSGYPEGIKGEVIPISGRLMALADVYDSLISKRVYKPPFSHSKAVGIIKEGRGRHFDPDMVDAFLEIEEEIRQIALEYADYEEERETLSA